MKKVIFIGGTSYSGSTFFDMILANDPGGFSCGEVHALFHPYRKHHYNPVCGCGDSACNIWDQVKARGKRDIYNTIFDLNPDVNFIIDSSKDPLWISKQSRNLERGNIATKNILIWKTPSEMAASCEKRGHGKHWAKKWVNYHRLYFSLIENFITCPYKSIVQSPRVLEKVCDYADIPYSKEKIHYWETTHHTLFGNTSAKIHTRNRDNMDFINEHKYLEKRVNLSAESLSENYRTIHYDVKAVSGDPNVVSSPDTKKYISEILTLLEQNSVYDSANSSGAMSADAMQMLKMNKIEIYLKGLVKRNIRKFRNLFFSTDER